MVNTERFIIATLLIALIDGTGQCAAGTSRFVHRLSVAPSMLTMEAADRFADGIAAVNAPICTNPSALSSQPTPADRAEIAYLTGLHFRHVRDGYVSCYNQSAYESLWKTLAANGTHLFATDLTAYTTADIENARTLNPGLEAIGFGNEWDVRNVATMLGASTVAGASTISINGLAHNIVPGQTYQIEDQTQERFTIANALSRTVAQLQSPLASSHQSGTSIVRVGDFVSDVDDWLQFYSPLIRHYQPTFSIAGASLAFPTNAEPFAKPTNRTDGRYGLDAVEDHGYPSPMGSNPEAADGNGERGYIQVNHPPCSIEYTSYSIGFDTCEDFRQTGSAAVPIWTTEFSYEVVPNGASSAGAAAHAIPDQTAVAYLARSYFFTLTHKHDRLYWFQMLDGTDGPSSGFCTYGLIYTGLCSGTGTAIKPQPKGELLTLGSLIKFFTDTQCHYPTCRMNPPSLQVQWSDPSAPLNTAGFAFHSGKLALVAWLGAMSYQVNASPSCFATTSCFTRVVPRVETLSSPGFNGLSAITSQTIDVNLQDPMPPATKVQSATGQSEIIVKCPNNPLHSYYGCITPPTLVNVFNGQVTLPITDVPTILSFVP